MFSTILLTSHGNRFLLGGEDGLLFNLIVTYSEFMYTCIYVYVFMCVYVCVCGVHVCVCVSVSLFWHMYGFYRLINKLVTTTSRDTQTVHSLGYPLLLSGLVSFYHLKTCNSSRVWFYVCRCIFLDVIFYSLLVDYRRLCISNIFN